MKSEEKVLCFKRSLLEKLGVFQGISLDVAKYFPDVTAQSNIKYVSRGEAEQDRRYKQLIPYALIICGDKILRYRRGQDGAETRLWGAWSVGVGGHITRKEQGLFFTETSYRAAMRRELLEEVSVNIIRETAVAVINDDDTEVGAVHFGIVHIVQLASDVIANCRGDIVGHEFIPMNDAVKNPHTYEPWSRFCLENLYALLARAAASVPDQPPIMSSSQLDAALALEILERRVAFGI